MKQNLLLVLAPLILLTACTQDKIDIASELDIRLELVIKKSAETNSLDHFILPNNTDFEQIPQEPLNPLTSEKVALGKLLFFETGLGLAPMHSVGAQTYSCASCHVPDAGFRPGAPQGIADGGIDFGYTGEERSFHPDYDPSELDVQGIRPLSVVNVAFVENTLWNGQFGSSGVNEGTEDLWSNDPATEVNHLGLAALESQNIEGLDLHRMVIDKEVLDTYGYTQMFDDVFGDIPIEERYTKRYASFAISAYLRNLLTNQAPFQQWLKGDKLALSESEKRGALLFFDKANCVSCHRGKSFNAPNFYALGVKDLYEAGGLNTDVEDKKNLGRGGFTKREEDMFKFKVPQLYNLKNAPFYFHGSSKYSLTEVIDYFDRGVPENPNVPTSQIANNFEPLNLTAEEKKDLLNFLENSLYDAEMDRYVPQELPSNFCFPNNDPFSKLDLGCD